MEGVALPSRLQDFNLGLEGAVEGQAVPTLDNGSARSCKGSRMETRRNSYQRCDEVFFNLKFKLSFHLKRAHFFHKFHLRPTHVLKGGGGFPLNFGSEIFRTRGVLPWALLE